MDAKIAQFCQVTGCADPAKARFFLESSNGEMDAAISAFFEHGDQDVPVAANPDPAPTEPAGGASGTGTAPPARASSNPRRGPARLDNVRGLGDVRGDGDDDDDDDKPQEWYTGGAQSGSVVQDPKKKPSRVEDILDGARAAGAVDGTADDLNPSGSDNPNTAGGARRTAFSGSGRTLGGNGRESTAVGVPTADAASAEGGAPPGATTPTPTSHVITFWQNGFTVDAGGELRRYDDPANAPFMQAVANGQCPPELAPADRNQPININLVRKETEYEPPPEPKYRAFQGSGRTLGGSSSGPSSDAAAAAGGAGVTPGGSSSGPSSDAAAEGSGAGAWSVDEGAPTTSVQLRLRDGSRVVGRFNLTHTVADVRAFIACASPANASGTYSLQLSGFPPKRLEDEAQAVGDGLANSVIIQR